MSDVTPRESTSAERPATLSVWDAVSVIVGIVVGAAIFKTPPIVFGAAGSVSAGLIAWALGAALCLVGALCYAELATMHRRGGGDYVFLTKAFGPLVGFLFGWAQLTGVFSGSIGSMAYVFADHAQDVWTQLWGSAPQNTVLLAAVPVLILTAIHATGVKPGKAIQNLLTIAKLLGLTLLVVVGLGLGAHGFETPAPAATSAGEPASLTNFGLAMILVLYAYGGWNDAVFVAAEVRDRQRNIPRALAGGLLLIAALYLLINLAYLRGLGFAGLTESSVPAVDVIRQSSTLPESVRSAGQVLIGLLVMVSSLGAVHGLLFTGSRLYAALGEDHRLFRILARWHPRLGTPIWALLAQGLLGVTLIVVVGTEAGRHTIDVILQTTGISAVPWDRFNGGFATLVAATAPIFWTFFLLTGVSLFLFRFRDPEAERPFRVPFYPVVPALFLLMSAWMLYRSVLYAESVVLLALVPLACGVPLYFLSRRLERADST
jgi:basic amino acid/polyamine antiporter, APA family